MSRFIKLPDKGDETKRMWSRRELDILLNDYVRRALETYRQGLLNDFGFQALEGRIDYRHHQGTVEAIVSTRAGDVALAAFLEQHFDRGDRVRILVVPEEVSPGAGASTR